MKFNEMEQIGDLMIGTEPPLVFRLVADQTQPSSIDASGYVQFTVGSVQLLCADKIITDSIEQSLAWFFMLYGQWRHIEQKANTIGDRFVSLDTILSPEEKSGNNFELLGCLSQMFS